MLLFRIPVLEVAIGIRLCPELLWALRLIVNVMSRVVRVHYGS